MYTWLFVLRSLKRWRAYLKHKWDTASIKTLNVSFLPCFGGYFEDLCMKMMWAQLDFFPADFAFSDKKSNSKYLVHMTFCGPKVSSKFWDFMQLVWTLTPNKFWTKCLRCLIFIQIIVSHTYFIEITTLISI